MFIMKHIKAIAFSTLLLISLSLNAQDTLHTYAGNAQACPGSLVTIPINVTNCNNIGSISLKLGYDPAGLVYQGYQNPHPSLAGGFRPRYQAVHSGHDRLPGRISVVVYTN
jgi:hypothetical protein